MLQFDPAFFHKNLTYLRSLQLKNGSFLSYSSPNLFQFEEQFTYHTTFSTSLILSALSTLPYSLVKKRIQTRGVQFLLSQKNIHWSWNYWKRNSPEMKLMPYPDDLDDTFCALIALYQTDKSITNGKVIAKAVKLLIAAEFKEGGPYKTWLTNHPKANKAPDLAVNSNIAYFLSLHQIALPPLNKFIESKIKQNSFISKYYSSPYPLVYFLSRFYTGDEKRKMVLFLLSRKKKDYSWGNPLSTALSISSLLNLGIKPKSLSASIAYLINIQKRAPYKTYPLYLDPSRNGEKYYAGSPALTTAFCLEAVGKYFSSEKVSLLLMEKNKEMSKEILTIVKRRFEPFDKPVRIKAYDFLDQLLKKDTTKQIPLLSYYFSLTLEKKFIVPKELLIKLGVANIFGWMAYTIYDTFLDAKGDPYLLSIANISLRETTRIFETLLPSSHFSQFFRSTMDQLDNAIMWELSSCRMTMKHNLYEKVIPSYAKNYKQLAHKSLGHALGPLAILFYLGYTHNSPQTKYLIQFFTHYLVLKQLNDDAHDWEEDLQIGHVNAVGALLLSKLNGRNKNFSFHKRLPYLQKLFIKQVLTELHLIAIKQHALAKKSLMNCDIITAPHFLEEILRIQLSAIQKALDEKNNTLMFIKYYGK